MSNNRPINHANAIHVRRHLYSPSQLPQGLTEGQLVMLLQKGQQYQATAPATTMEPPLTNLLNPGNKDIQVKSIQSNEMTHRRRKKSLMI